MANVTLVDEKVCFWTKEGKCLRNALELLDWLKKTSDEQYNHHVTDKKNDFSNWIRDVLKEKGLSHAIEKARIKKYVLRILEKFVKAGHFVYETIIIGGGIAGISAAIYASRKRMDYLMLSEDFGGQMNVAGEIENYPGFKHTDWKEFTQRLQEQMDYNGIEPVYQKVQKLEKLADGHFLVHTEEDAHEAETVIYATGARARHLNVPGEEQYSNKGLTYCAICDGPLFKDKTVAIVGGGDAALEAIDFLLRIAKKIYVLTINPKLIGHEYLVERVEGNEKVQVIGNSKTLEVLGNGKFVTGIKYEQDGQAKTQDVEGIFVEIGRVPNTEPLKGLVNIEADGHIIIDKYAQTSVPGIFAAGDCTDLHGYQFAISGGEGVKALLNAAKYLQGKEGAPKPK